MVCCQVNEMLETTCYVFQPTFMFDSFKNKENLRTRFYSFGNKDMAIRSTTTHLCTDPFK